MYIFGYYFDRNDPTLYLVAWIVVTLFLVVLAAKWGATAVGFALTALFGVIIYTQHNPSVLPSTPGASGKSGFGPGAGAGAGVGPSGGGSW